MIRFDFYKYATQAGIGFLGIVAYDYFVDGKQIGESFTVEDATTFALTTLVSNIALEVTSGLIPYINESSFAGMIAQPVLNGLVYMYLFDTMVKNKYPYSRNSSKEFYIGAFGSLLIGYMQSPLMSLFGMSKY